MSIFSLLLILLSACIHASWNLAARKVKGDFAVLVGGIALVSVLIIPVAFFVPVTGPLLEGVPFFIASGLIHVLYLALIGQMYSLGDVSLVYPVARGTGVALTAMLAGPVLGEIVSVVGGFGVASIISGIVIMSLAKLNIFCCSCANFDLLRRDLKDIKGDNDVSPQLSSIAITNINDEEKETNNSSDTAAAAAAAAAEKSKLPALGFALLCGIIISSYSLVDKAGVGRMNPIHFLAGMKIIQIICMVPYMLLFRRAQCVTALKTKKIYMAIVGIGGSGCYLIVLYVLTLSPSSYVTALREVSVVFGAILGVLVLKERLTVGLTVGVCFIGLGLVLIKMA